MKALILYVAFVSIGAFVAAFIGMYIENHFSSALSLLFFLPLFFANFVVSWIVTILVMDGSLKNAQGRQEQLDVERKGRMGLAS